MKKSIMGVLITIILTLLLIDCGTTQGTKGSVTATQIVKEDSSLINIGMTEKQVFENMKNVAEVVAILPGDAHTYKTKGKNLRSIGFPVDVENVEFLVTVNFRNGLVFSISTVRY